MSQDEERRIRAVLDEVYAAWEANDPDGLVAPYAEEATALLPGSVLPSREAIRETMVQVFAGPLKGTKSVAEVRGIRFVTDDVALVLSDAVIVPAGATEPAEDTRSVDSWVLSKRDGDWRVEGEAPVRPSVWAFALTAPRCR